MSYRFLFLRYELDYVLLVIVENDIKHAPINAIYAAHQSHNLDNHLEVRCSTPHFTAGIIALLLFYILE